jgi:arylsulfatase A-like enzyme
MLVTGAVLLTALLPLGTSEGATRKNRPSIVLILTDDQRINTVADMPTVQRQIADKGVKFANAFVVNALCCPSRAAILTGQYSHSNGVYTNNPPFGGFDAFDARSTIATWLKDAGYHTALIGKYLNHYKDASQAGYYPPGWSKWIAFTANNGKYYKYGLSFNGYEHHFGDTPADYSTDVLAAHASAFIRQTPGPLFLYFTPSSPHEPSPAPPRYADRFADVTAPRNPNYNEEDVSDKPAWLRDLPSFTSATETFLDNYARRQAGSLLAVDDAVRRILEALKDTKRLSNTILVFISDNGLSFGAHRWIGKEIPYEESIRVPMILRWDDGGFRPRTDTHLVLNIDLAPTFARAAGISPRGADGMSLLPLLRNPGSTWRSDFLIEHVSEGRGSPTYCAVRNDHFKYVEYITGEEELYDLDQDPYELENVATKASMATVRNELRARVDELCQPRPPGWTT